jgi:hypothetical protein
MHGIIVHIVLAANQEMEGPVVPGLHIQISLAGHMLHEHTMEGVDPLVALVVQVMVVTVAVGGTQAVPVVQVMGLQVVQQVMQVQRVQQVIMVL